MLKVFVKSDELDQATPTVLASYDANAPVADDAHKGATPILVSEKSLRSDKSELGLRMSLAEGWRDVDAGAAMRAEANRRIAAVLPPDQQISTLIEMIGLILKHGADPSRWPPEADKRKAEIERLWNYARAVNERAATPGSMPLNPTSDKVWPTRIT